MTKSVEIPISKRRNRSSNSSTNVPPDTKKPRSSQNYSEQLHVEEDGEPPLATPSMIMPSKDIQKTLNEILEKLGKLDIIESSVYKLQATLLDLETRTKTLEGFQHKAVKDINDLQETWKQKICISRHTPEGRTLSLKTSTNSKKAAIKRILNMSFVCLWKPSLVLWTQAA